MNKDQKQLVSQVKTLQKEVQRKDGWINALTGIGGRADKRKANRSDAPVILTDDDLENLYFGEGFASTIVDVVADDMTREWIEIESTEEGKEADGNSKIEAINKELERLSAQLVFNEALKWKRLYGGSIIVVGALDGDNLEKPLSEKVKGIGGLRVVDRTDVFMQSSEFQTDPNKPNFGNVVKYSIQFWIGTELITKLVHASRCIVFKGKKVPSGANKVLTQETRFWGISELQNVNDKLSDFGGITSSVVNVMHEFVVGKYTIKGLAQKMAAGKEADVVSRMNLIGMMKSVINSVLLDEGESYSRDSVSLASIPEIMDRFMMFLSGVAKIPVTKLFGRSAAGMNATGEGDLKNYYDTVKAEQQISLRPAINQLVTMIKSYTFDIPTKIEFNPLFQMSEKEEAEIEKLEAETEKIKADTYSVLVAAQILDPAEVFEVEYAEKFSVKPSASLPPVGEE
jgi:phage-related protein (TIGR01555 family)